MRGDLEKALREIFRKQFDDMFREFTYQWVLAEDPVLATEVEEITKPAEAFIQGWSGELARIMNLNTKDAMERLLLKAQENSPRSYSNACIGFRSAYYGKLDN